MLSEIIKKTKAYFCLDCGKCTALCPVTRYNKSYSPRKLVIKTVNSPDGNTLKDERLWSCLTCMMCQERCPSGIDYIEFTKLMRKDAKNLGFFGEPTHGGIFESLWKIMTAPKLNQNRLDWLTPDLKISDNSEYLYFVGCLPYFDQFFSDLKTDSIKIAQSVVKILNFFGVEPKILKNERCCGHDLLWTGDFENFKTLAEQNIKLLKDSNVKYVITSCPECLTTFKLDYPEVFGNLDLKFLHITEFISEKLSSNKYELKRVNKKVTYQDPCRLGRYLGIYQKPREVITSIPGIEFTEMERSGRNSVCCGTSCWTNCDRYSKLLQIDRLKEAKSTGAELLLTACPKCQIHFSCAQKDENYPEEGKIEIVDLTTLFAEAILKQSVA